MTNNRDIKTTIKTFYKQLYTTPNKELNTNIPKVQNQGSEGIPKIENAENDDYL